MKSKIKKIFKLETYEDMAVKTLQFFMHRNPLFIFFWFKYYLFEGAFRKDEENKKIFYNKYQSFNQKHPYFSASTSFILILLILASSFWFVFNRNPKEAAAWWDDTWGYRAPIQITNSSGSDLTDFQVAVTIDTETLIDDGKMQSACQDMRFTDKNGAILPYWIEENNPGCDDSATKVWLKIPTVHNGTNATTVYFYYGNQSASDAQNGENVFEFFDDFNDYLNWIGDTDNFELATDSDRSVLKVFGSDAPGEIFKAVNVPEDYIVEVAVKDSNESSNSPHPGLIFASNGTTSNYYGFYLRASSNQLVETHDGGFGSFAGSFTIDENWHTYKAIINSGILESLVVDNASQITSFDNWDITNSFSHIGLWSHSNQADGFYDSLFVRKYASTEPSAGATGSEEKSQGPVGYWKFDEGYGTTAYDETSNSNDGTISGATWKDESECVSGKCLYFDGVDDYVDTFDYSMSYSGSSTFSLWFKPTTVDTGGKIKSLVSKSSYEYMIAQLDNGIKIIQWNEAGSNAISHTVSSVLSANEWCHLVFLYNGSEEKSYVYLNGNLVDSQSNLQNSFINRTENAKIGVGYGWGGSSNPYFNGFIDEFKIYNYARSADQINQDYNAGLAGAGTISGTSATAGSDSPKWMSDGLIGHWKMDEASWNGTSGEVIDASGNGNNGTAADNATTAGGKFGNGGSFDGDGDYVDFDDIDEVELTDITFSMWAKFDNNTSDHDLITKGTHTTGQPIVIWRDESVGGGSDIGNTDAISVLVYDGDTQSWYASSSSSINDSDWHHIVVTIKADDEIKIYIDGSLERSGDMAGTNGIGATISPLRAGADSNGDKEIDGSIDDVRIYNRALSPQEVEDLYNWAPGPVAHWKMDENSGTTAYDTSGNGNDGTLTNMDSSTDWVPGKYGNALDFDGNNDYISSPSIEFNKSFSIGAWVKSDQPSLYHSIFGAHNEFSTRNSVVVRIYNDGHIRFGFWGDDLNTSAGDVLFDSWQYICATYDYDDDVSKVYVNGEVVGQNNSGPLEASSPVVSIGSWVGTTENLRGLIDDVRIYNYARTPKQVIEDMNAGHPAGGSPVGSQVGYWKFDEGYGSVVNNSTSSQSQYSGTLYNTVWSNEGKFGKSVILDGTKAQMIINNASSLRYNGGDMTLSIWFKPDATDDSGNLISKPWNGSGVYNYTLSSTGGANPSFNLSLRGATTYNLASNKSVSAGSWHYISVSVEGSSSAVKFYVDGILTNSGIHTITDWTPSLGDSNLNIVIGCVYPYGGSCNSTGSALKGSVDELKIYNAILTEEEIQRDYNQGKSLVIGSKGTESDGETISYASSREYCVPGDTATCNPPVAEWKFDEMTGATAYDTSGNGNNGTLTNGPTWEAKGKVGSAIRFDGDDDYLSVTDSTFISPTGSITVESWVYFDQMPSPDWGSIYEKNSSYMLYIYGPTGKLRPHVYTSTWRYPDGNSATALSTNQWYYIAYTYNSSDAKMHLYINGKEDTNSPWTFNAGESINNSSDILAIAGTARGEGRLKGLIDDVKIYNYARTPAQIAWDYNRGKPVGWWKMDEGEGTTVYDWSGNSNNGTMTNMASDDWVSGKINTALDFDGSNDYVGVGNILNMGEDDFSLSAWVKSTSTAVGNNNGIVYKRATGSSYSEGYRLNMPEGQFNFHIADGENYKELIVGSNGQYNDGNWHHVVAIADRGNEMAVYVDGKFIDSTSETNVGDIDNSTNFAIGALNTSGASYYHPFNGQIDDVRVYNYALTEAQVKEIYNNGAINFR